MSGRLARLHSPAVAAALVAAVAALVLLPGLGDYGLWTDAELPIFDRVRAAMGEALRDLERSPWLPDLLRQRSYAAFDGALGFRLPHALCAVALAALATVVARLRGGEVRHAVLAGAFALAFPLLVVSGRTALGNPVGELCITLAIVLGVVAQGRSTLAGAGPWVLGALGAGALAVTSVGLLLGAALPLAVVACAALLDSDRRPAIAAVLGAGALACLTVAVMLSLDQGDGYIPLLGEAKDPLLVDKPQDRRFAAGVEDLGYSLYPWAPLVVAGALLGRRDRWPALWLGLATVVAGGWSVVYGITPLPVTVPAALCAVAAVQWLEDPRTDRTARRAVLAVVILATLVLRKDAEHTPSRLVVPLRAFEGEHNFPGDQIEAPATLERLGGLALLALFGVGLLGPTATSASRDGSRPRGLDRLRERLPPGARALAPSALLGLCALHGSITFAHQLVPDTCDRLSPRALLEHHAALVESGVLPPTLGNHRVRDGGLALYGPGDIEAIGSRRELSNYLAAPEPRAAIIRARDLPSAHQNHRAKGWPLFVLDDRHGHLRLVANRLPEGATDLNKIPQVVFDEPPALANPTLVSFENYIDIIGWEVTEPIVRGGTAELQVAIRVHRALPGGTKLYARFLKDRTSRINSEPHELTDGIYPPNMWREGDYILHRFTFTAPLLEIQPGDHEFIIGLRRGEKQNFGISTPEGKTGEYGVKVRGKKRNFARIGTVEVW